MKFVCPRCSTRYSIADEKVPVATTLRFPCKKCGTVIRLKRKATDADERPVAAARSATAPDKASTRVASLKDINKLRAEAAGAPTEASTRVASLKDINKLRAEAAGAPTEASTRVASLKDINKLRAEAAATSADGETRVADLKVIGKLRAEAAAAFEPDREATRVSSPVEIRQAQREDARYAEPPAPPPEEEVGDWYVLVGGKQKGPLTPAQVMAMLDHKEIDQRTYVWKDGMGEWERLAAVADFKERAAKSGPAAWRVMQPTGNAAAYSFDESTVAMAAGQLKQELAKTRSEPAPAEIDETPILLEGDDGIERLSPEVSEPELLNALAGVPTSQGMAPAEPAEVTDDEFESAELVPARPVPTHEAETQSLVDQAAAVRAAVLDESIEEPVSTPLDGPGPESFHAQPTAGNADAKTYFADGEPVDEAYVAKPPGESTKLFMATAGIYKRRRTHRIAATVGITASVLLVGTVSLDIVGVIQIPGMGIVYDVTGLVDPNKDRAVKRVEDRLSDAELDPAARDELEGIKRRLMGAPPTPQKARTTSSRAGGGEKVVAGEGIKEAGTMSRERKDLAAAVFGDSSKRETMVNLAEATEGPAPNLPSGLTQETIFKVITENSRSMNLCLTESMKKGEKLSGKMEIVLTIAPDGSVPEARIDAPELKSTQMAICTIRRIRSWRFPRFNGEPVTVSYPYLLQMGF